MGFLFGGMDGATEEEWKARAELEAELCRVMAKERARRDALTPEQREAEDKWNGTIYSIFDEVGVWYTERTEPHEVLIREFLDMMRPLAEGKT